MLRAWRRLQQPRLHIKWSWSGCRLFIFSFFCSLAEIMDLLCVSADSGSAVEDESS